MRKPQPILLVEGGPEDCDATKRALSRSGLTNAIFHCEDGDAALDFLSQKPRDFSSLIGLIGKLKEYWFEAVILPKSE